MSVLKSFTAVGVGAQLFVRDKDQYSYSVSGTFVGTVVLERTLDGGQTWQTVLTATGSASGTLLNETRNGNAAAYRFQCTAYTSGTIVTSISDVYEVLKTFTDKAGNPILEILENGVRITGNASVSGTTALSGPVDSSQGADIASAATVDLDSATGDLVDVTGTTTITAITLTQGYTRIVRFTGALILTNGASLVLPGAANITTAAGDYAIFAGYASGVVRCVSFVPKRGVMATLAGTETLTNKTLNTPTITGPSNAAQGADIASASTIDLDAATGNTVDVTGTTPITAITLSVGRQRVVRFTGALTLTNGASLVLPGGANIATAAGDCAIFVGYAAGVVRCVSYSKLNGQSPKAGQVGFLAQMSDVSNVTGSGTDYTVIFDVELFDVGSNYNPATGVFTAPVAGKYAFSSVVNCVGCTIATDFQFSLVTTAKTYYKSVARAAASTAECVSLSMPFVNMAAGDTARMKIQVSGEASDTVDLNGDATFAIAWFNGALVG